MKKAYSYIRYSSPQQAKGDSYRRQLAATQTYCENNGYELDTDLSLYKELGVSGFQGDQENLKRFIQDCETGKVEKDSLLIVENLDRLSRQSINIAMRQFLLLLDYVNIYTLQDQKFYSSNKKHDNDNQLLDIMTSLIIMSRAYEESITKQKRLKESWENKRVNIKNKKITSSYPHWLTLSKDKTTFKIKEDRANIIKEIFQLCLNGMGGTQIIKHLNNDIVKYPPPSKKNKLWVQSTISLLLSDRRLLGEIQLYSCKKNVRTRTRIPEGDPIKDYFPKIIDEKTYLSAQIALQKRKIGKGKTGKDQFSNIFRSFLYCSYCGNKIEYVDKGYYKNKHQRYLTCTNAKRGGECKHSKYYRYEELELMLTHLITENGFMPKPKTPSELNLKLQNIKELHDISNKKLKTLLEQDFTASLIVNKINELNKEIELYESEIKAIENKLMAYQSDYEYDQLYYDIIKENDSLKKYNNRINFNHFLSKNIESAYLFEKYKSPIIIFKMSDSTLRSVILDEKYNFGGCSLPNGKDTFKRLNGEESTIDPMIWTIQQQFLELIDNSKDIQFIDNDFDLILSNLSKIISKLIINQDIDLLDLFLKETEKASNLLLEQQKKIGFFK